MEKHHGLRIDAFEFALDRNEPSAAGIIAMIIKLEDLNICELIPMTISLMLSNYHK